MMLNASKFPKTDLNRSAKVVDAGLWLRATWKYHPERPNDGLGEKVKAIVAEIS